MLDKSKQARKPNRRSEILRATQKLMQSRGLSGVTTRQISHEVGCSEGALYVHFKGRLELLLAMLEESLPDMLGPLNELKESVGIGSPHANLVAALDGIFTFHQHVVPASAGLFAEPELLTAYRKSLNCQRKGPHLSMRALEQYIQSEQKLGRIASQVNAKLAAHLLISASFFRAFVEPFFGKPIEPPWTTFAEQLAATITPEPRQVRQNGKVTLAKTKRKSKSRPGSRDRRIR